MRKSNNNDIKLNKVFIVVGLIFFVLIIVRVSYLAISTKVDGINLQVFASKRTTKTDVLKAKRGTIYDSNGNVLAQNVSSYTLIAYLDSSRTVDMNNPKHVVDKELTAEKLSTVLDISKDKILSYLNTKGVYQTEFGSKGKGLTELTKDAILALELPGIDFIETQKRYYPFGQFLSYTLGYAKNTVDDDDTEVIKGEMGIEKSYNDALTGEDGFTFYQKDRNGYKISGTDEVTVPAVNGSDVYLTVDSKIQLFVEQAISNVSKSYSFEWMTIMLADAKTGAILSSATYPSFDPNKRDITNYLDYNISYAFEPGSTMKTYTYMATMENGNYDGDDTYTSGVYVASDGTEIGDWKREGWGVISFDKGYLLSSNVGAINLINRYISGAILKTYYKDLGFGSKTGIELPGEVSGKVNFKYETEIFNAAFGQGITTTPIQNIKALTAIANNGTLLKPYIVDKVVNQDGVVTYQGTKEELETVASDETINKIKDLMRGVIEDSESTGHIYYMDGYDLIGKTGTAQVANEKSNGYTNELIRAFAGMFPGDDPEVIVYAAMKTSDYGSSTPLKNVVQEIVKNVSKYLEIDSSSSNFSRLEEFTTSSYINKNVNLVKDDLDSKGLNYLIIGDGDTVIMQYPSSGSKVTSLDLIILKTNGSNIYMPNLVGYSTSRARLILSYLGNPYKFEGSGYVIRQSIKAGVLLKGEEIILTLNKRDV